VPMFRGSNPVAGIIHDWCCRKDPIIPGKDKGITKQLAADVYSEFQRYYTGIQRARLEELSKGFPSLFSLWAGLLRGIKTTAVRVAPGYFQKYCVADSYETVRFGVRP